MFSASDPVVERLPAGRISQLRDRFSYGTALIIQGKRSLILLLCIYISLLSGSVSVQLSVRTPLLAPTSGIFQVSAEAGT